MPPVIKWQCITCGKSRIMGPDVTLVLCSTIGCKMKQLIRVGNVNSKKTSSAAVQLRLFGEKKEEVEEPLDPVVHAEVIDDYDPDAEDI